MSALPYSSAFKWSRSVKDIYMRGKANLKKFFSESFCKLEKKQTSRSNQYSTSPLLPVGFHMGTLRFLSKSIILTKSCPHHQCLHLTKPLPKLPERELAAALDTADSPPPHLVSTPSPPSFHLDCPFTAPPPGSCHLCKLKALKWPRTRSLDTFSSTCVLRNVSQTHCFKPHLHTANSLQDTCAQDLNPELSDLIHPKLGTWSSSPPPHRPWQLHSTRGSGSTLGGSTFFPLILHIQSACKTCCLYLEINPESSHFSLRPLGLSGTKPA